MAPDVAGHPTFDCAALFDALDASRRAIDVGWYDLAAVLWEQSEVLNARLGDHPLCGGAIQRVPKRGAMSCQYALYMLRWLDRAPEDFLTGPVVDVGGPSTTALPTAGPDQRLRFDLAALHAALDDERTARSLTWVALGDEIGCTPSRLTNLRRARLADMDLTMRLTQWLRRPAAEFVTAADW